MLTSAATESYRACSDSHDGTMDNANVGQRITETIGLTVGFDGIASTKAGHNEGNEADHDENPHGPPQAPI